MDKAITKKILLESISNLQKRRGQINIGDIEAEVINNACYIILSGLKKRIGHGNPNEQIFIRALSASEDTIIIAKAFTDSAIELFPEYYTIKQATVATIGIQQNIAWEGMWDFLRDYFQKNHGIQIDDIGTIPLTFYSTKHKRYENGILTSESAVERIININFIDNKKDVVVSIEPSLSPKKGYLISNNPNQLIYKGYDPDYLFNINFDSFEEIEVFTLEMPNRNLKIIYFE